ncbi:PWI domain-containing protein [Toxoplasma gondii MAS]|uniref:PWI domain-containing protein n=1 Tax=Toxoplasma gondii MAS TaxID=943118 RepID=A0A086QVJ8_TOXGO|nr:PWI domain-containing protein [Toxoplasma gondii MAS]
MGRCGALVYGTSRDWRRDANRRENGLTFFFQKNILDLKLRPWVRKKVCEFMGAEESLVLEVIDYIVKRVSDRPPAEELLGELAKFLDEEAEGFVRNMWRLLIYEQLKLKECSE